MAEQFHKVNPFHIRAFCDQVALETSLLTQKQGGFHLGFPRLFPGASRQTTMWMFGVEKPSSDSMS